MPTFTKTKTFASNESPIASADLNSIGNDVATFLNTTKLDADNIQSGALTNTLISSSASIATSKLATTTAGYVLLGATTTGIPTFTAITGAITVTGGGVTSLTAGTIVNADVSASAAIAHSKLAATTAGYILMGTTATGVITGTVLSGDATITGAGVLTIANNTITNAKITDGTIATAKLADPPATLGYAAITSSSGTLTATTETLITGLSSTVTIPTTTRKVVIETNGSGVQFGNNTVTISIWDGTVGSGTQLAACSYGGTETSATKAPFCKAIITAPSPGSKTYNIGYKVSGGSTVYTASATAPAYIHVYTL